MRDDPPPLDKTGPKLGVGFERARDVETFKATSIEFPGTGLLVLLMARVLSEWGGHGPL